MKKAISATLIGLFVLTLVIYWQWKKPRPLDLPVSQHEIVRNENPPAPLSQNPQNPIPQAEVNPSKPKQKNKRDQTLAGFPQKKMFFSQSRLWILQGVTATTLKRENEKEVARLNHYYVYQTPRDEQQNIVYDEEKRQYGVLTLELTVVAQEGMLQDLARKYGLHVLREGAAGAESILRSDSNTFFTRDLPDFAREEGLISFRPYVSYGLARYR